MPAYDGPSRPPHEGQVLGYGLGPTGSYGLPLIRDVSYAGVTNVVPSAYFHGAVASAPDAHTGRSFVMS